MKKGIFGSWFREFATIVFTQTVQAFLLAIVLSVIVSALAGASNGDDAVGAAGLLAIIALSSFGKIEMLIKNIFGVTSAFGDPGSLRSGRGITAGTLMAARGVKQISDNVSKFGQASRKINQGKAGLAALNANNKKVDTTNAENPTDEKGDSAEQIVGKTAEKIQQHTAKIEMMGDMDKLATAIKDLTKATNQANKNDSNSQRQKYQDMINEGKDLRRSAVRENIGASIGGIVGATSALATGDNPLERGLAGAGVGDQLGKMSANRTAEKQKYNQEMDKLLSQVRDDGTNNYKETIKALTQDINDMDQKRKTASGLKRSAPVVGTRAREMRDINKEMRNIQKQIDNQTNSGNS